VTIDAFEPLSAELARTQRLAEDTLSRSLGIDIAEAARCIRWHRAAVSNETRAAVPLRGLENQASLSPHIPEGTTSPDYVREPAPGDREMAPTLRLDIFANEYGLGDVLLMKIDTEGHDFEALQGAEGLLRERRVAALTFEIAGQMNSDFFRIHKERHFGHPLPPRQRRGPLAEPNLRFMVRWLGDRGFDSFLLGSRSLVPLVGIWWDTSYEVCAERRDLPCWYDVLALTRALPDSIGSGGGRSGGSDVAAHLRSVVLGAFESEKN